MPGQTSTECQTESVALGDLLRALSAYAGPPAISAAGAPSFSVGARAANQRTLTQRMCQASWGGALACHFARRCKAGRAVIVALWPMCQEERPVCRCEGHGACIRLTSQMSTETWKNSTEINAPPGKHRQQATNPARYAATRKSDLPFAARQKFGAAQAIGQRYKPIGDL